MAWAWPAHSLRGGWMEGRGQRGGVAYWLACAAAARPQMHAPRRSVHPLAVLLPTASAAPSPALLCLLLTSLAARSKRLPSNSSSHAHVSHAASGAHLHEKEKKERSGAHLHDPANLKYPAQQTSHSGPCWPALQAASPVALVASHTPRALQGWKVAAAAAARQKSGREEMSEPPRHEAPACLRHSKQVVGQRGQAGGRRRLRSAQAQGRRRRETRVCGSRAGGWSRPGDGLDSCSDKCPFSAAC